MVILVVVLQSPSKGAPGFSIHRGVMNQSEIDSIKVLAAEGSNDIIKQMVQNSRIELESGYEFQDYIFVIKKSSIHTCHRDANGDMFNEGQQHPSYTMLLFIDGGSLNVVPGSQNGRLVNLEGIDQIWFNPGDLILFDANLVHAGSIGPDNLRIQMKITHRDDRDVLSYYEKYNKTASKDSMLPEPLKHIQQKLSCSVPAIADLTQGYVKSGKNSKLFSQIFYGNENFYELEGK
jgi:hypothetical protein